METFKVVVAGEEFEIAPALHPDFYTINQNGKSAIIGKDEHGNWVLSMQTTEAIELPVEALGSAIEQRHS